MTNVTNLGLKSPINPRYNSSLLEIVYSTYMICILSQIAMGKHVTIMIDEDLDKKLRLRQAKIIHQEQSAYSYSRVVNDILRKVLK